MSFTESDWKLFKNRIAGWQEAYIDKLNQEYIELLSGKTNPSEKFWKLEKRINEDKEQPGVMIDLRRSSMIYNIASLLRNGVITDDDLEEFSDELKNSINIILN